MAISLFEHNETAYYAALSLMKKVGKAAIVHPTGTGKSVTGTNSQRKRPKEIITVLKMKYKRSFYK